MASKKNTNVLLIGLGIAAAAYFLTRKPSAPTQTAARTPIPYERRPIKFKKVSKEQWANLATSALNELIKQIPNFQNMAQEKKYDLIVKKIPEGRYDQLPQGTIYNA